MGGIMSCVDLDETEAESPGNWHCPGCVEAMAKSAIDAIEKAMT